MKRTVGFSTLQIKIERHNFDERGRERTRIVAGGDRVVIPAHTPHLYEFLEDTVMTESWVHARDRTRCAFEAWFHAPLRGRVGDPKKTFANKGQTPERATRRRADAKRKERRRLHTT